MNKLITFLLLLNLVTTLAVGYTVYTNVSKDYDAVEDKKFKENMYQGMSMIMSGQSQVAINQQDLNMGILRVHHFVAPHSDRFYEACPECQKEKKEILEGEKDNITLLNESHFNGIFTRN